MEPMHTDEIKMLLLASVVYYCKIFYTECFTTLPDKIFLIRATV